MSLATTETGVMARRAALIAALDDAAILPFDANRWMQITGTLRSTAQAEDREWLEDRIADSEVAIGYSIDSAHMRRRWASVGRSHSADPGTVLGPLPFYAVLPVQKILAGAAGIEGLESGGWGAATWGSTGDQAWFSYADPRTAATGFHVGLAQFEAALAEVGLIIPRGGSATALLRWNPIVL